MTLSGVTNAAAVQAALVQLTWQGDAIEVCFQTTVGHAKCSLDQSITNQGNAVTTGSTGVSDKPRGDDSGYATFLLPANPTLKGCEADLSIVKMADSASVGAGGQVMYTLVVQDHGPGYRDQCAGSDALPAELTAVSTTPSQGSCTANGAIDCALGTIDGGGTVRILVVANVSANASGQVQNCATTSGFQSDPNIANNGSCASINVVPPPSGGLRRADVQVVKHVNHSVAKLGQVLTYTLDVKNNGADTAPDVKITDTSAIGLRVLSIKPSQGTCAKAVPFTCDLGSMAAGQTAKITIRATPSQTGSEVNSVSGTPGCTSSGVCPADPNLTNNVSAAKTSVRPYLKLVKTASSHTVKAGHLVTDHLKVSDPTPITLHQVRVCDRLPLGLVYVSSSRKAKLSNGQECWSYKTLRAHKSQTIRLVARALHGTKGAKTNHARATARGVTAATARATVHIKPGAPTPAPPVTG